MSTLLSFDTATEQTSLALTAPSGVWTRDLPGGPQASALLVPQVLAVLAEAGVSLQDVDAIGFGRGPGAFTGLRTACSVAQGLAFGAGKPVLPLGSLLIVAEDARTQLGLGDDRSELELWVAMDARMDEVYAARYRRASGRWQATSAPGLYSVEGFAAAWAAAPTAVVAGTALAAMGERLHTANAQRLPQAASRAAALARVAQQAWADGAAVDAALALPLYVRDKVAQTTAEREQTRAARDASTSPTQPA